MKRGLNQRQMHEFTGVPLSSYQRLEAGKYVRVPYEQLKNCAIVLELDVEELLEERYKGWTVFSGDAKEPPSKRVWSSD